MEMWEQNEKLEKKNFLRLFFNKIKKQKQIGFGKSWNNVECVGYCHIIKEIPTSTQFWRNRQVFRYIFSVDG